MKNNRKVKLLFAFREYVKISNKKKVFIGAYGKWLYTFNCKPKRKEVRYNEK